MSRTTKLVLIIGGIIVVILIIVPLILSTIWGWSGYGYGMMGPGMMGGFGGMGVMSLLWIVVLGLIIWAVVSATRGVGAQTMGADSALEILKKRYARGEITKQEYEDRKRDLG